jgi:hypothetical protein
VQPIARRQRRRILTDKMVGELKRKPKTYVVADPELGGHYIRVQPDGPPHAYYVITRDALRKQRWVKIGSTAQMPIAEAREIARTVLRRLKAGEEPFPPPAPKSDSVRDVVATYFARFVEKRGIVSAGEKRRIIESHIVAAWGDLPFASIRRSQLTRLCDAVEDAHGPWVADTVLIQFSSIARWYATREDDYSPPIVKGMRRIGEEQRKRSRVLAKIDNNSSDDELRSIWKTAEASGAFGALVRLLLLTAQRREKVRTMRWTDLDLKTGVWTIPTAAREKGHGGTLKLPEMALRIIRKQPRIAGNPYVFAGHGKGALAWLGKRKSDLDKASGVKGWVLHDLRRTARSLMSRAGVPPHIAERVLGHAVGSSVERIYDQHEFEPEKAHALQRLADTIEQILHGEPSGNVVQLPRAAVAS